MKRRAILAIVSLILFIPLVCFAQVRTLTLQNAASSGNGIDFPVVGMGAIGLAINGSAGADRVVNFIASIDGTTFDTSGNIQCRNIATGTIASSVTTSGTTLFQFTCSLAQTVNKFRAAVTGGTTGTVTVVATASFGGFVSNNSGGVQPRVVTLIDAATVTPDCSTTDIAILTTLSQATTIANPNGSCVNGQRLIMRIKSVSAQTLTFGTAYRAGASLAFPTATTGGSKTDYYGFIYNSADTKLDFIAKQEGF